jgi:hypothetical protein
MIPMPMHNRERFFCRLGILMEPESNLSWR